jgi:hypothetical protein
VFASVSEELAAYIFTSTLNMEATVTPKRWEQPRKLHGMKIFALVETSSHPTIRRYKAYAVEEPSS